MLLTSGRHIGRMVDVVKITSNMGRKHEETAAKRQQDHLHHTTKGCQGIPGTNDSLYTCTHTALTYQ